MAKLKKKPRKKYIPDGKGMWEVKTEMKRGFLYITSAPITVVYKQFTVYKQKYSLWQRRSRVWVVLPSTLNAQL